MKANGPVTRSPREHQHIEYRQQFFWPEQPCESECKANLYDQRRGKVIHQLLQQENELSVGSVNSESAFVDIYSQLKRTNWYS
jgi:hypothetical protein